MTFDRQRKLGDTESKDFRYKATDSFGSYSKTLPISYQTYDTYSGSFSLSVLGGYSISKTVSFSFRPQDVKTSIVSISYKSLEPFSVSLSVNLLISFHSEDNYISIFNVSWSSKDVISSSMNLSYSPCALINKDIPLTISVNDLLSQQLFLSFIVRQSVNSIENISFAGKNSYYINVSITLRSVAGSKGKMVHHKKTGYIDKKRKIVKQITKRITPFK